MHRKGLGTTKVSKVKGHAKDEDVEAGLSTREDQIGNNFADDAVNEAKVAQMRQQTHVMMLLSRRAQRAEVIVKEV